MTSLITSSCSATIENLDECVKSIEAAGAKVSPLFCTQIDHSGYRRYLYHQSNKQTTGGTIEAAAKPWLIPAGKYIAAHRPQGQHPP